MWQFSWLLLPLLFPVVLAVPTVWILGRYYGNPRLPVVPPILLVLAATLWGVTDAIRIALEPIPLKMQIYPAYHLTSALVVASLFVFAIDYTERSTWRRPRRLAVLLAPLVAVTALEVASVGELTVQAVEPLRLGGTVYADVTWGPMFYAKHALSYVYLGAAAFMFLTFERTNRHFRGQIRSIVAAMVVPWALNLAYLVDLTAVNYTAVGFALAVPIGVLMIYRYRILDIVPVARTSVIDEMDTGYLVLDEAGVVVDVNDRACEILDVGDDELLGRHCRSLSEEFPVVAAAIDDDDGLNTMPVETDDGTRQYSVELSQFEGTVGGSVILFQDVTDVVETQEELRRQKSQVERQNERLEEFASLLSHDLRNPLSVAEGRLQLARDDVDNEHLSKVAEAHDRMDELIEGALSLAKQGQTVVDPEPVSLRTVAERAWSNVETGSATLRVETDQFVYADASQLSQLLENLMRNSLEHGQVDAAPETDGSPANADGAGSAHRPNGAGLSVTVGDVTDDDAIRDGEGFMPPLTGFFVEDDGPGIPADEREYVFEKGYSTDDEGTGFGLSIVKTIADAHGWSIDVTEGRTGGARFEISDVTSAPDATAEDECGSE